MKQTLRQMKKLSNLLPLIFFTCVLGCTSSPFGTDGFSHYEPVKGWGITEGHTHDQGIGSTHGGIVIDKIGRVYVSSNKGIFVFDQLGHQLNSYTDKTFTSIHAMVLLEEDGTEYIYGARNNAGKVVKLDLDGTLIMEIPFPTESGITGKYKPTSIAVLSNGHILVADGYGSNVIFQFDPSGKYISHFGGKNKADIQKFQTPHGLTIDTRYEPARLLVCDREKRRLVHFDLEGNFIEEVITGLRRPCAVSIKKGYVAVAELEGRVVILDPKNELIAKLGDNPNKKQWANYKVNPSDWHEGIFTAPHGLCWDAHGNLYVQDWSSTGRITKWGPTIP